MKKKRVLGIIAILLALVITVCAVMVLTKEKADYSLLKTADAEEPVYEGGDLPESGTITLGASGALQLDYSAENHIFYIRDTDKGTVFSTGASADYYVSENAELSDADRFMLCQVSCTDFGGNSDAFTSAGTACSISGERLKNGAALKLYFDEYQIGFKVEVWLNEYGLRARVPESSITEDGVYGVTAIALFPLLGSAIDSDSSYAVYPDGSGSICRLTAEGKPENPVTTSVYFNSSFDLDEVEENSLLGNLNALMPVYSICRGETAVAAYVTEGDGNSFVTLSPSTSTYGLNRMYMSCRYRKQYSYISPSDVEINEVERKRSAGDFSVQYIFLSKDQNGEITYGNMAAALREFMLKTERLTQSAESGRVNLQLIMGTKKNTSMSKSFQSLTTFGQAKEIANAVTESDTEYLRLFLLGWQKNGYGLNPAGDKVSLALGGKSELSDLNKWAADKNIGLYLVNDYVYAQKGGSNFNKNSQAAYNEASQPITNSDTSEFLLNPLLELKKLTENRLDYLSDINTAGIAFDKIGTFLYDDYQKGKTVTRKQCAEAFSAMLTAVKEKEMSAAAQGGNAYVLKYADYIYDLPERNSEYSGFSESIPFYQMIVHGVKSYCGTVPGNMAADYQTEKLKWIEYGSEPYFVLTYESSERLKDTYVTEAFATEYTAQLERIKDCIEEFKGELNFTATRTMTDHRKLDEDLVRVTYSDGHIIYINYGDTERTVEGVTVKAKDYTVAKGGNAQ